MASKTRPSRTPRPTAKAAAATTTTAAATTTPVAIRATAKKRKGAAGINKRALKARRQVDLTAAPQAPQEVVYQGVWQAFMGLKPPDIRYKQVVCNGDDPTLFTKARIWAAYAASVDCRVVRTFATVSYREQAKGEAYKSDIESGFEYEQLVERLPLQPEQVSERLQRLAILTR
ncbi:hypothetical protein BDY17DRAFT_323965 [Neohortaea acidophila]|uniref:Uncharacterized protein n=1 Tax=Neohortaea acidophila TaxID=245834 RepID=A0A6A6PUU6_9PEZI|nr:uncharacterized protein BDY17DRAFT_323965 [Neohortaea acidophila]KAF2483213.1 hypothetical protein BDY17DRAFT_323965 [Neohortaea acidophila]